MPTTESTPSNQRLFHPAAHERQAREITRQLTPERVDHILRAANDGDPREQAQLAVEILEKDWDIAQAVQTRVGAVTATAWQLQPADDSAEAGRQAAELETVLRASDERAGIEGQVGISGLIGVLMDALLPGYAVAEILWRKGGGAIEGFLPIAARHFTVDAAGTVRLVTRNAPLGLELPANTCIVHRAASHGNDPARGGLIRPLAWLYIFKNLNLKDLLRYLEKYGMPFLVAKLDSQAFDRERHRIAGLVRNFGSDGGGVFTDSTKLEMLGSTGGNAEAYLRFLDYCERAICKVVLGQTSTSDARDSNRSTAAVHNEVRHELLQADCAGLSATLRRDLLAPLARFHYGNEARTPCFVFQSTPPLDRERESRVLANLRQAGYAAPPEAVAKLFGYPLTAVGGDAS